MGTASGNWSENAHWSTGSQPTGNDVVHISLANGLRSNWVYITETGESCATLFLGENSTPWRISMSGGSLSAISEYIGYGGTGVFKQSAGTNTVNSIFMIGANSGGVGSYTLSGGSLSVGYIEYLGYINGTGTFTQNGGDHSTNKLLLTNTLGTSGAYNLNDGKLTTTETHVGGYDTGVFTQSGGIHNVSMLYVADGSLTGDGAYNLSGGTLAVGNETLGAKGKAVFAQTGGTHTISSSSGLRIATYNGSEGTYNLNGGTLALKNIVRGAGAAQFNFGGGTLQTNAGFDTSVAMGFSGDSTINTNGCNVTFSDLLSGAGGFVKNGAGILTISNQANTYVGDAAINEGMLLVTGALGADSLVTVNDGATLGGTGTLGSVVINDGGILAPGASIGTLTLAGDLTLADDAVLVYELATPDNSDLISMPAGTLTIDGLDLSNFRFEYTTLVESIYTLIDAAAITGSLGGYLTTTLYGLTATLSLSSGGDDVLLTLGDSTPPDDPPPVDPPQNVPEPSSLLIWGLGLAGAALLQRRKKRQG